MMVLVLSACPQGLRGSLTKWLYEVSAGVFVGHVSARVRTGLWDEVVESSGTGRAIVIWSSDGEQRMRFDVKGHEWQPIDHDGLMLMRRPAAEKSRYGAERRRGWSKASGYQHARRYRGG